MTIRVARPEDAGAIARLLDQLGYPGTATFLAERIAELAADPDEELVVAEQTGRVVAVLSLHVVPQLALVGPFARISYLCVDAPHRGQGIGAELLAHAEAVARDRGCDRLEVHCAQRREEAQGFYHRHGYGASPCCRVRLLHEDPPPTHAATQP